MASNFTFLPRHHPVELRIWHWLNALVISGLLMTVILRRTLFNIRQNVALIQSRAPGAAMDSKIAKEIAHGFLDRLWQWHVYLGFALAALLIFRIVGLILRTEKPWAHFHWFLSQRKKPSDTAARERFHLFVVRSAYVTFYLATLFMVLSGLTLAYSHELQLSDSFHDSIRSAHEIFQWFFAAFVFSHVGGVVWAELGKFRGIISNMIHGGDQP